MHQNSSKETSYQEQGMPEQVKYETKELQNISRYQRKLTRTKNKLEGMRHQADVLMERLNDEKKLCVVIKKENRKMEEDDMTITGDQEDEGGTTSNRGRNKSRGDVLQKCTPNQFIENCQKESDYNYGIITSPTTAKHPRVL